MLFGRGERYSAPLPIWCRFSFLGRASTWPRGSPGRTPVVVSRQNLAATAARAGPVDGSSGSTPCDEVDEKPIVALHSSLMRRLCLSILLIAGCGQRSGPGPQPLSRPSPRVDSVQAHEPAKPDEIDQLSQRFEGTHPARTLRGKATYYSSSLTGHPMASGERYDPNRPQAAHRTLPFGTIVRVTNVHSNESVVVRIVDRGPYGGKGRIIDLSYSAARKIGIVRAGVADVRVDVLEIPRKSH